jgi:hypothetical protein
MQVKTPEVLQTLHDLIDAGLAKAYRLGNQPAQELSGMPTAGEIGSPYESRLNDLYFYLTQEGMNIHLADYPDWPFDDDNILRKHWSPPQN